jgi:MFS family permease
LPKSQAFFLKHWDLSNSQAGWINGIYFAGYTIAVPLLTSLTDRIDARKIYWISCGLGALANLGFALLSYGFWSALFFRAICGFGLAGTFIPGLKALIDRLDARYHPRAVSFYTACFGLGMSISFYFAGSIFNWLGWKPVFGLAAAGSFIALGIALIVLIPQHQDEDAGSPTLKSILNFKPVWENRLARQYIIAYMCHMWEMFAARWPAFPGESWLYVLADGELLPCLWQSHSSWHRPSVLVQVFPILRWPCSVFYTPCFSRVIQLPSTPVLSLQPNLAAEAQPWPCSPWEDLLQLPLAPWLPVLFWICRETGSPSFPGELPLAFSDFLPFQDLSFFTEANQIKHQSDESRYNLRDLVQWLSGLKGHRVLILPTMSYD